jgi:sodium-coupled monocarboxylate transporter 8/12
MMMYMGIVVYAPALALSAVTGLSFIGSILAVGGVCTFYSTLGGMKAVLLTDVFQSMLMYASIIAVIVVGSISVGGLAGHHLRRKTLLTNFRKLTILL